MEITKEPMNSEQSLFHFIDFYLSSVLSQKNIELIKVKIDQKSKKIEDPLLRDVTLIKDTLKALAPHSKINPLGPLTKPSSQDKIYTEIHRLKLEDALILTTGELFPISSEQLSLALQTAVESIVFRREQLKIHLHEEGVILSQLTFPFRTPLMSETGEPIRKAEQIGYFQKFQRLPMALRFLIETGLVLSGLLALLWIIPEIRNRYETSIQKRINDYLIESSLVDSPAPPGTSKTSIITIENQPTVTTDDDEESNNQKSSFEDTSSRKQPKVNEGETWRFSFTGSATSDIETAINSSIQKLNITDQKPTIVPGGIQYDFILPMSNVLGLKGMLEQAVAEIQQHGGTKNTISSLASFSWYKKQKMSTRKIPGGHVQIIIWISTL